ncbi:hypothetical protein KSF_091660 [Reticulibacter mediterranei]|uniref:Uncharacterized protein n=1 Tax=Reticulibacter mediterranei TaxID=2778369 RepID=A0A8J3IV59_9CHLR|nr:hypothetical protein KSF_091660 [Reticulibacter mediterranei]
MEGDKRKAPARNAPPPLAATGGGEGIVCYGKCGATRTDGENGWPVEIVGFIRSDQR